MENGRANVCLKYSRTEVLGKSRVFDDECRRCILGVACLVIRNSNCVSLKVVSRTLCGDCLTRHICNSWIWFTVKGPYEVPQKGEDMIKYHPACPDFTKGIGERCNSCQYGITCTALKHRACRDRQLATIGRCKPCGLTVVCNTWNWLKELPITGFIGGDTDMGDEVFDVNSPKSVYTEDEQQFEIATRSIVPFEPDDPLQKHFELIAKRKGVIEREMIALAKEMWTVSTYVRQKLVVVKNCKFSVALRVEKTLGITLVLADESKTEKIKAVVPRIKSKSKKSVKTSFGRTAVLLLKGAMTSKDSGSDLITWRELIPEESEVKAGASTLERPDAGLRVANFSVTSAWKVEEAQFPPTFAKLLPTARMLVQEQLDVLQTETETDMAFIAGAEIVANEGIDAELITGD